MGALAAGTTGGIAAVTNNASATISGDFTVSNGSATLTGTTLQDVLLEASADWSFDANAKIHGVEIELAVGATPDTLDVIARHERTDISTDSLTGTAELTGSVIQASDYGIDNFTPSSGELTTRVIAELRLFVLRAGEVVLRSSYTDTFEVTVSKESLQVSSTLSGSGSVSFETATPTATPDESG
jgi:hypothetical protein